LHDDAPAAPAVRDMLERVLRSDTFSRSERSRDLLRYLVEREQAGEKERLKGFTVAMDVFGKDKEFDPSTDAVVRVQAGRLRDLLTQYYQAEGAADPLKIYIPRGGYVPSYRTECPNAVEEQTEEPAPAPVQQSARTSLFRFPPANDRLGRHIQMMWATLMVVIVLLGLVVIRVGLPGLQPQSVAQVNVDGPVTASIAPSAAAELLPTVYVRADAADAPAAPVANALRSGLAGFDTVDLMLGDEQAGAKAGQQRFIFDVETAADGKSVSVGLSSLESGKVLMARAIPTDASSSAIIDQVADILSSSVNASGVLYGYIAQNGLQAGLVECLLLNDAYYLDQNEEKHLAAYRCLEALEDQNARSPLVYSELAALHMETVSDGYGYPKNAKEDEAFAYARRAVKMGPTSAYAHRALGFLFGQAGDRDESIRWMRKAHELNGYDLSMVAAYGYALVFSGSYAEGEPIMTRAVEASSAHASWWDYGLFLARFMLDDREGAAQAAQALKGTKRQHYLAALVVVADAAGDTVRAGVLLTELNESYPRFVADPAASLTRANHPADFIGKLIAALRAAGMGSSG
jgi:tetratricopeptide (TPR) repeat protein